jgi:signal transduction histidine kinase
MPDGESIIRYIKDVSRLEGARIAALAGIAGNFPPDEPEFRLVDLAHLTCGLARSVRPAFEKAGLSLIVDIPPLPREALVDPDMWQTMVLNLLSNAFKFTLQGGIAISLKAEGGEAVLSVADTGAGFAEQPPIFESFSHRGLQAVQALAELHGGRIDVQSEKGRGSIFTLRLPFEPDVSARRFS